MEKAEAPGAIDEKLRVVAHEALDARHWLLTLGGGERLHRFRAGQFAMLQCGEAQLLRRPLSLQRATTVDGEACVEILYRVMGEGTAALAQIRPGAHLDVLGPLGRPFQLPAAGEQAVLMGGGVGIPPMVALAREILAAGGTPLVIGGISGTPDRACLRGLFDLGSPVTVATMDGSQGVTGTVLDALDSCWSAGNRPSAARFYACGPVPMLAAIAGRARADGFGCQLSVEARMGCGYGACVGCSVPRSAAAVEAGAERYALACKDGPVFDAHELDLAGLKGVV